MANDETKRRSRSGNAKAKRHRDKEVARITRKAGILTVATRGNGGIIRHRVEGGVIRTEPR